MANRLLGSKTEFNEMLNELRFDEEKQKLFLRNGTIFIASTSWLAYLLESLEATVGWEKTTQTLYRHGYDVCEKAVKPIMAGMKKMERKAFIEQYWKYAVLRGWGLWEITSLDETTGRAVIRGYDKAFGTYYKEKGVRRTVDSYFAGIVAGLIHFALGKDVDVRETKCLAMGDTFCEFVAEPK